jgi:hypothetical protein
MAYELKGELDQAVRAIHRTVTHGGRSPKPRAGLAGALVRVGREDEARQILQALRAEAAQTDVHAPAVARVLFSLRQTKAAFDWLDQAYRERHPDLPNYLNGPGSGVPREDRRFLDLMRRLGLNPN